jgi:hypothetical protein
MTKQPGPPLLDEDGRLEQVEIESPEEAEEDALAFQRHRQKPLYQQMQQQTRQQGRGED